MIIISRKCVRACKAALFGIFLLLPCAALSETAELADLERISISETMLMMPMRDGVRLATDIYRPKSAHGKVPIVFVKTPYDFNEIGGAQLQWAYEVACRLYEPLLMRATGLGACIREQFDLY